MISAIDRYVKYEFKRSSIYIKFRQWWIDARLVHRVLMKISKQCTCNFIFLYEY